MKVTGDKRFSPITIILENGKELEALLNILRGFAPDDISHEVIMNKLYDNLEKYSE